MFVQLDIDDFKYINDLFSHQIGDEALRHLSTIMCVFFPHTAILGRSGGDEFIIVLHGDELSRLERMVKDFSSLRKEFYYGQQVYHYTISMGYAAMMPGMPKVLTAKTFLQSCTRPMSRSTTSSCSARTAAAAMKRVWPR